MRHKTKESNRSSTRPITYPLSMAPTATANLAVERINRATQRLYRVWSGSTRDLDIAHRVIVINLFSDAMQMLEELNGVNARQVLDGLLIQYAAARGLCLDLLPIRQSQEETGSNRIEVIEGATKILRSADRQIAKAAALSFLHNRMRIAADRGMPRSAQTQLREGYRSIIDTVFDSRLLGGKVPIEHFIRLNNLWDGKGRSGSDHAARHLRIVMNVISVVQRRKAVVSIYNGDAAPTLALATDWAVEKAAALALLTEYERFRDKEVKTKYAARLVVCARQLAMSLADAFVARRKEIEESRLSYARRPAEEISKKADDLDRSYRAAIRVVLNADRPGPEHVGSAKDSIAAVSDSRTV